MQTTTKKPIHELLYMSAELFEDDHFERYLRWCMSFQRNQETDLTKLLANRKIANYYSVEFQKLQLKFINAAEPIHGQVNYKVIRNLYTSITAEIFTKFPKPLFDEARTLSIINSN